MFEKAYRSRYHYVRAIQYDGTAFMMLDLINEYHGLAEYYGVLHVEDGSEIWDGDWILIQDGRAKAVIPDDYFDALYTQVKLEEYNENRGTESACEDNKGCCMDDCCDHTIISDSSNILTTHDLHEIDEADDEKERR